MANTALYVFFYLFLYIALFGALNCGLIGVFNFNLIQFVTNQKKVVEKGVNILIGFAAIIVFILSIIVASSNSEKYVPFTEEDIVEE